MYYFKFHKILVFGRFCTHPETYTFAQQADHYEIMILPKTSAKQMVGIGSRIEYHIQVIAKNTFKGSMNVFCEGLSDDFYYTFYKDNQKIGPIVSDIQIIPCHLTLEITALRPDIKRYQFNLVTKNYWDGGSAPMKNCNLYMKVIPRNQSGIHLEFETDHMNKGESNSIYGTIMPPKDKQKITLYLNYEADFQTKILETDVNGKFKDESILSGLQMGAYTLQASWIDDESNTHESDIKHLYIDKENSFITCMREGSGIAEVDEIITISGFLKPVQSSQNIHIEMISPDGDNYTKTIITDNSGHYRMTGHFCNQRGTWRFKADWKGNNQIMNCESDYLPVLVGVPGKVIILGGGEPGFQNLYWDTTKNLITNVYLNFKKSGFTDDLIYLMIDSHTLDINNDDIEDPIVDEYKPTKKNFIDLLNSEFTNDLNHETLLFIYMQGHGTKDGRFQVADMKNFISATELSQELDTLQDKTNCNVVIILESCYSGKFIPELSINNNHKRIVLTSTGNDFYTTEESGMISFSNYLFQSLIRGNNLEYAYQSARDLLNKHSYSAPLLADNDHFQASSIYLPDIQLWDLSPHIENVEVNYIIKDETFTQVSIKTIPGSHPIQKVSTQIIPPFMQLTGVDNAITLKRIEYSYNSDQDIYIGNLDGLYQNGIYTLSTYAMDNYYNISEPYVTYIHVSNTIQRDINNDGVITIKDVIMGLQLMCQIPTGMDVNQSGDQIDLINILWCFKKASEHYF